MARGQRDIATGDEANEGSGAMQVLKVSSGSHPRLVAGAVAGVMRSGDQVCLQVVGAGALNQAVKALAVARTFLGEDGIDLVFQARFHDLEIGGEQRTAIRLELFDRAGARAGSISV